MKIVAKIAGHAVKKDQIKQCPRYSFLVRKILANLSLKQLKILSIAFFVNPKNSLDFMFFNSLGIDTTKLLFILI
ncbi:hypothetical protein ACT7C9_01820 [Bacillus cereus]